MSKYHCMRAGLACSALHCVRNYEHNKLNPWQGYFLGPGRERGEKRETERGMRQVQIPAVRVLLKSPEGSYGSGFTDVQSISLCQSVHITNLTIQHSVGQILGVELLDTSNSWVANSLHIYGSLL
ncbi:hypothetical protein PROFUN_11416 [Planoprotostelium fungivorum]|uniref:Uncharacterized protein n=1 Tax=Planoprotostelium fungivorum TaxID=1890364 RepID=A0A2P6NA79_9EUKA|nr:hypothetical protein PROFUN_11416 [Planoprotostelium fungivorum]